MKKWFLVFTCITAITFVIMPGHGEGKSKKMYVASIQAQGVSQDTANRIRERITLAIFEKYGTEYYVVSDDDIRASYAQAEKMMVQGSGDEMLEQIAGAIDADEIIHGTLSSDNGKLRLSVKNLARNRTSSTLSTKSMALVSFFESQADWYAAEAAYRLMNPRYTINEKNVPVFDSMVRLADIKITNGRNLDISIMQFASSDESVSAILSYLKELVGKGDDRYTSGDYPAARVQYGQVLDKIATKLTPDKQARMSEFTNGVKKRMGSAWALDIKTQIEAVDALVAGKTEMDEKTLTGVLDRYLAVRKVIGMVPADYAASVKPLADSLTGRTDNVRAALANHRERAGNTAYTEYRFEDAEKLYKEAQERAKQIETAALRDQLTARYNSRVEAVRKTGEGYLYSRVQALCDRAELANVKDDAAGARDVLDEARKMIEKSLFKTARVYALYNTTATVVRGERLSGVPANTRIAYCGDMEFVEIPGGSFMMGGNSGDEAPRHQVTLSPFQMGRCEVTQKQYTGIMGANPSYFQHDARLPVEQVSWYDAVEFCNRLSEQQGLKPYYAIDKNRKDPANTNSDDNLKYTVTILGGSGFRLPTEAEWEYTCRAGTITEYYWGDELTGIENYANVADRWARSWPGWKSDWKIIDCDDGHSVTAPVGLKKPNAWGLYDMTGNVWEWCYDWYDDKYYGRSPAGNPVNLSGGESRVLRGGSWGSSSGNNLRSANRDWHWANSRFSDYGFRLARFF